MARYCVNGHEVGDHENFCPHCGAKVKENGEQKVFCKKCGHERVGTEKFCSNCGTPYEGRSLSAFCNKVFGRRGTVDYKKTIGILALLIVCAGLYYWFAIRKDYSLEGLGKTLVENDFWIVGSFSDGLAMVATEDGKIGYMDKDGKLVVPCKYDMLEDGHYYNVSDGLILVSKDWKLGFVDRNGKEIIPCKYSSAGEFSEGLAAVLKDEKWGFIDKNGKEVIPCKYDGALGFSDGFSAVERDGKWGFIDKNGKEVISCKYDWTYGFSEGLAAVLKDEKWGFIDKDGKVVIPCKFRTANSFSDGLAIVTNSEYKWGAIDKKGNLVVPLRECDGIDDFHEGLAVIHEGMKYGYMDQRGEVVIPCIYDVEEAYEDGVENFFSDGLALVSKDGQYGFIDKNGKEVIPLGKYDAVKHFSGGLAAVVKDDVWGFINTKGESTFDYLSESQMIAIKEKQKRKEEEREEELRRWEEENKPVAIFNRLASNNSAAWSCTQAWRIIVLFFYPSTDKLGRVSYVTFANYDYSSYYPEGLSGRGSYTITENYIICDILVTYENGRGGNIHLMLEISRGSGDSIILTDIGGQKSWEYKQIRRPSWDPLNK